MAAMADLQVLATDTVGPVGAMPASTDAQQDSDVRVLAECIRTCTFKMSFPGEGQVLITG